MTALPEAQEIVRAHSITWYEPVMSMPPGLSEATTAAYLCMRAIDEIEDHPVLDGIAKSALLRQVSATWQSRFTAADIAACLREYHGELPAVTLRLGEWSELAPAEIAPRVVETFACMAERMAHWVETGFTIRKEADLDRYTYAVAGTLVLMLADLWAWHDGTSADRSLAVGYGRALQAVNIVVDRDEDIGRGVDFWPDGWGMAEIIHYAQTHLTQADAFLASLPNGPARTFCASPLARAHQALKDALT